MSDCTSKSSSSLVVADKNTHKPGGCVGIFFKLFDWNRRFSKKKLFPKKLLAPSRGSQVSKKLSADDNLTKTKHLLSGDGKGGLGSEVRSEMRAPSLVAKLMGLESMPAVKPQSADKSPFCGNGNSKNVGFVEGLEKEVLILAKGGTRSMFQPRKVQKTGLFERRPINRFGADALQIRNVLSRSRRRHPKLASPVKSPRVAKSSLRLMDAATRILEPGLQATSRAKCALTYSNPMNRDVNEEVARGAKTVIRLPVPSSCSLVKPQDLKAQTSCRNCGHALEGMDPTSDAIEQNPTLDMAFFDTAEESKRSQPTRCDRESEVVLLRSRYQPEALTDHGKVISVSHQHETILQGMHFSPNDKKYWGLHDNSSTPHQRDASPSVAMKHRTQVHSHPRMVIREDRIPPRSTSANMHNRRVSSPIAYNEKKDFIAMNRNVSESQFRLPRKPENCTEFRRQYRVPQDDAFSTQGYIVTKRPAGACRHVECSSSSRSVMAGSRPRFSGNLAYPTCAKSQPFVQGGNVANWNEDINAASFSFNCPLTSNSRSLCPTQMNHMRMDQSNRVDGNIPQQKLVKEGNHGEKSPSSLLGNEEALGSLLVQKLKELTSQGENESTAVTPRGRTAAGILQELISALTVERSSNAVATYRPSQADARGTMLPTRFSGNHFSPGSVLDASFSNDSCVSSSIDDSSGNMHHCDLMDLSFDDPQLLHSDADLYDSSSSFNNRETSGNVPVIHLLDHISRVLDRANMPAMKLSTAYSGHTKEVLFNSELLFGNADHSERFVDFLVGPFLFELETLAIAAWRNTITSGFRVSKGGNGNPLRRFLFDCLVECLNTRYERYINSGFVAWCRLPRQLNMEALIQVFDYEVMNWASLTEMNLDEIIELEMSASLGKWTDLEAEMFEAGAEIGLIVLQGLVDEVIADFLLPS